MFVNLTNQCSLLLFTFFTFFRFKTFFSVHEMASFNPLFFKQASINTGRRQTGWKFCPPKFFSCLHFRNLIKESWEGRRGEGRFSTTTVMIFQSNKKAQQKSKAQIPALWTQRFPRRSNETIDTYTDTLYYRGPLLYFCMVFDHFRFSLFSIFLVIQITYHLERKVLFLSCFLFLVLVHYRTLMSISPCTLKRFKAAPTKQFFLLF